MHFNFIKGGFSLIMDGESWLQCQNKITSDWQILDRPRFMKMCDNSAIIFNHTIDVTDSVTIGKGSVVAGTGSQIWTHSFYLGAKRSACVMGEVTIGNRCYIGANSVICAGVHICDNVAIGAGTTVSKDIIESGLYVSQPLRYMHYNADNAIDKLGEPILKGDYRYRK